MTTTRDGGADQSPHLVSAKLSNSQLVLERQAELVQAATDLFLQRGFHKTTTREIAAAVGWNMARLYLYISTKEDVLFLVSDAISRQRREGLLALPPCASALDGLRNAAEYYMRTVDRTRREMVFLYRETASLRSELRDVLKLGELEERDFIAAIIRQGLESGEFCNRDVVPDLLAYDVIMLSHMWALKSWGLGTISLDEYLERQVGLIIGQLCHK
jgi:AcrR family transcriptional regulator